MTPYILAALCVDRSAYEVIAPAMAGSKTLDPIMSAIFNGIHHYYTVDESAEYADLDTLFEQITAGLSNPKHKELVAAQMSLIKDQCPHVSTKNVKEIFRIYKEAELSRTIAATMASTNRTGASELLEEYLKLGEDVEVDKEPDLEDLIRERFNEEGLMPIYPSVLNAALDGGARKEHHLLVFARPEAGKSLISINIACGLARHGFKGLFLENEDRTDDTRMRFWNNLSGMTKEEIRGNTRLAQEKARANGINNIRVQAMSPGTPGEVKYYIKAEKPDFVIVNQIRNLNVRSGSRVEQLERAATEMRNIGKKFGTLQISITQAGDSADQKLVLDQGDVDFSNTGIPAACDVMIGVGVTRSHDEQDLRTLGTCKNKLSGKSNWYDTVRISKALSAVLEE